MGISRHTLTIAVAPMMERTDRHCRYLLRLISPETRLYTEMITAAALVRGGRVQLLEFHPGEHPVALQLGGSDPSELARAAALGAAEGYDEINLNVGCPSDRVQAGRFGAALMAEPERVAACLGAMMEAVDVPLTVKTRTGIDDLESYGFLRGFVGAVADAGCRTVIVHARKAVLSGLSPKQNRQVPPLDYGRVYRLKSGLSGAAGDPQRRAGLGGEGPGPVRPRGRGHAGAARLRQSLGPGRTRRQARPPPRRPQPGGHPGRLPAVRGRRGQARHAAQGHDPALGGAFRGPPGRPGMAAVLERTSARRSRSRIVAAPRRKVGHNPGGRRGLETGVIRVARADRAAHAASICDHACQWAGGDRTV